MNKNALKFGLLGGALEVIYCSLMAIFFWLAQDFLNEVGFFCFLIFLLLFVFSAAVSALLVLGYPFYLFLKKKYREALFTVIVSLLVIILLLILALFFYRLIQ